MLNTIEFIIGFFAGIGLVGLPLTALGGLVIFYISRSNKPPMDTSNRFAHARLIWCALREPHKFVGLYYVVDFNEDTDVSELDEAFPWLTKDEGDIVDGVM